MSIQEQEATQQTTKHVFCKWINGFSTIRLIQMPVNIECFDCSPDGKEIAIAISSETNAIRVYDIGSFQEYEAELIGHLGQVYMEMYSPLGNLIASASLEDRIIICTMQFTPCSQQLTIRKEHTLDTWCCNRGVMLHQVQCEYNLAAFRYSAANKYLLFGDDVTLFIREVRKLQNTLKLIANSDANIHLIENGQNGKLIIVKYLDSIIRIWAIRNKKLIRILSSQNDDSSEDCHEEQLKLSPNLSKIITTDISSQARLWDFKTAKYREINRSESQKNMNNLRFSADGRYIIYSASQENDKIGIMRLVNSKFMKK